MFDPGFVMPAELQAVYTQRCVMTGVFNISKPHAKNMTFLQALLDILSQVTPNFGKTVFSS